MYDSTAHGYSVIYTAHHASHAFHEFRDRCALTDEERVRFSDYGTAQTVPRNGLATLVATHSRALGDLNRDPDDPGRFQDADYARPKRHAIWHDGAALTPDEKHALHARFYEPFHGAIVDALRQAVQPTLVVAWDNTADYIIGKDTNGSDVQMPSFILSNRGGEHAAEAVGEPTSCDPHLLLALARHFAAELKQRGLPTDIYLNLVYRGGYITRHYSTRRQAALLEARGITQPVQSLQLEYNTKLTHDQQTLKPRPENIQAIRESFEAAIASALGDVPLT